MTKLIQMCQVRRNGTKCSRIGRRWCRFSYTGYAGAEMSTVWATCDRCATDERITEDLGPIEITEKVTA